MENKTLKLLVDTTQGMEYLALDANRRFNASVKNLIEIMQDGVGYVAFDEDSSFPLFHDKTIDETRQIMAVRVHFPEDNYSRIEIMTDDNFDETFGDGWYNPILYGDYDIHNLFDCLKAKIEY